MEAPTKYEKAANAITNQSPNVFFAFMKQGGTLIGIALDDASKTEVRVEFSRAEVTLLAKAYDLTHGQGYCPYGSRDMWTLTEKYLT